MPRVLHVLPHPGGGGETYLDVLASMEGYEQDRMALSATRSALGAGPSIVARWPGLARRAGDADLVHVHGDMAAMIALRVLRGRPSLVTTHGLHFLRRARGVRLALARRRMRGVAAAADRIVCTSSDERAELAALLGAERARRLVLVPNGIPLPPPPDADARARARAGLGLAGDEVAVLYLGQLEPRKDPLTAVGAAERARAEGVPLVLLVAGEGPLSAAVERAAGEAVRPLGRRDDADELLAAADVFVMPSHREGMSMAVLEAMGRGVPVVVSDGAGNPETVGSAGLVVPAGDAAALAAALVGLTRDRARRAELGVAGRARVAGELSAQRMVERTREVYDQVLAQAPPTAPAPASVGGPA